MKVALADISADKLQALGRELMQVEELQGKSGESNVLVVPTDVSKLDQVVKLRDRVYEAWGEVSFFLFSLLLGPWEGSSPPPPHSTQTSFSPSSITSCPMWGG
jgi:hypothetical protein